MRLYRASLLAASGFLVAASAYGRSVPDAPPPAAHGDYVNREVMRETELYCMTLALFFEGGSTAEPEIGQRHIARVVAERAKANRRDWGGNTICGVVFHQRGRVCQFSFACLPLARRTPRPGAAWDLSASIARAQIEGRNEEPHDLIRYYMNADLTPLKNICWFKREFIPVVRAGRHEFFREPTTRESRELAQNNPDECKRYLASLKSKKPKGKKHYAKLRGKKKAPAVKLAKR